MVIELGGAAPNAGAQPRSAAFFVSSVTGNTATVAAGVREAIEELGWAVNDVRPCPPPDDDVGIVCFWCRKGSLDPKSLRFVNNCTGQRILLFGTMGGFPVGAYAQTVRDNVIAKVSERNECLGVFLCQGKVNAERIKQRRNLPEDDPHHLDDWGVKRLLESQNHPNATDVLYAQAFARDHLPA